MGNCAFFRKDIEWLGFQISHSGVKPLVKKSYSKPKEHFRIKIIL